MIGSVSVISEAVHSGADLVAALIAWFAVRTADKPADEDHPFGHGKIENISGTVEALLIFLGAAWIIYQAVEKLIGKSNEMESAHWGILVMLISAGANMVVSSRLFKIGKATHSIALEADGWHLLTDVYTSAGVAAGLGIIWIGGRIAPGVNLQWLDPVTAIAVALLIIKAAWELTLKSSRDLLDAGLPEDERQWIGEHVRGLSPTVRGFHRLRTRRSGSHRFIQFHLMVDAGMSVIESHDLHDQIVSAIKQQFANSNVIIHIEPCNYDCSETCIKHCLLDSKERERSCVSAQKA
jgi:cation diffusion facilitator family transporter